MQSSRPIVMIVGGWSPGPFIYLKPFLSSHRCSIVEPSNLPMPPFPGNWCCDPKVVFMFVVQTALVWMSCQIHLYTTTPIIWNVLAVLAALVWFRLLALVVVRSSINKCIQICLELIFQREHDNINMVVVGFSWGAAVLAEMLAKGIIGGKNQPSALLIAPTTSLVASVVMEKDAALRVGAANEGCVHVVHGTLDSAFCPDQERWSTVPGITLHRVQDNHVFFQQSSQTILEQILSQLLQTLAD